MNREARERLAARLRTAIGYRLDRERPIPPEAADIHAREWVRPTDAQVRFWRQTARPVDRIIVHHSAGSPRTTVDAVRRFHQDERGWRDIGYHLCIRQGDGDLWRVETGRSVHLVGAHDGGQNTGSIGVCLFGDYSEADPTEPAQELLVWTLATLLRIYGLSVDAVEGHRENEPPSTPTTCPGFDPARLRAALRDYIETEAT